MTAVWTSLSTGSLFLLAASMLGPIAYLAFAKDNPHYTKPFPSGAWHVLGVVLIALLASSCCTVIYLAEGAKSAPGWVIWLSLGLFVLSVALSYTASVFDQGRVDPRKVQAEQDSQFFEGYSSHRRSGKK